MKPKKEDHPSFLRYVREDGVPLKEREHLKEGGEIT